VVFESFPGIELALKRLEPRQGKHHPELRAVQEVMVDDKIIERATVFIPDGTLGRFMTKIEKYLQTTDSERPRNFEFVDRIRTIGLASLKELWTDPPEEFPPHDDRVWWEVWLRKRDGQELDRLGEFASNINARVGRQSLGFADRTVVLLEASASQLGHALDVLDDLAELRGPREPAELLALEPASDQAEWVAQLAERTLPPSGEAPSACIVDTGVHQSHPLSWRTLLHPDDCHSCNPNWNTLDDRGHGTEMAGLALYGELGQVILSGQEVRLRHRLESVRLLPPQTHTNLPELYGALTATAASLVEIQAPSRRRVFSLAVTDEWVASGAGASRAAFGQPTSWSSAIDALSAGLSIDVTNEGLVFLDEGEETARRLFILAAGNVRTFDHDHLTRSDLEPVEDPGQAWNALTVGAHTNLDDLSAAGAGFSGYSPIAPQGELSPFSRTSVPFDRVWPIKPDIVYEGGNLARSPAGTVLDTPEVMQLLTTKAPLLDQRLLTVANGTSAATAQISRIGALILADYPSLWPETIRALIVHSSEWTPAMRVWLDAASTRVQKVALHRRYGMGVPDLVRATRSASDALTLIVQDVIHPFDGQGRMREMHLHDLPWPTEILAELGSVQVRLRVTLSYFIEPNPGRRGWVQRYTYPSHGLRFDVRKPTESTLDFRKRINKKALAEEERRPKSESDASEWFFGPDNRTAGSLHTDIWQGTAADLAQRGVLAIYPVTGWWKERKERDHSDRGARYALIVSIETPEQEVDIWTPVAQQVGVPIEIET
jgi:hypothetical protein